MTTGIMTRGAASRRAPGLHFVELRPAPVAPERPVHGKPVFVGFGARSSRVPTASRQVLELTSWEHFCAWVDVPSGGYLDDAVRGFFANGGTGCAVLPVEAGADRLKQPFDDDGVLEDLDDVDLVCVPDAVSAGSDPAVLKGIQSAVLRHCEAMGDRFAILDAAPVARSASGGDGDRIEQLIGQSHWHKTRFGALYFPWLRTGAGGQGLVPPCGHVAGQYARADRRAGVHKAPANEVVEGVVALECALNAAQHGRLNDAGVNCIRSTAGTGIRVYGARTLSGQPDWLYVPVVRLFLALTAWLKYRMDQFVFESHTPELWQAVERAIAAYCRDLMDSGALAGRDAESAYFVKCDAELNPSQARDTGRLVAVVGLAPALPAEFVVVRITHDADGIQVTGVDRS